MKVFLGVDLGSVSCNLALIDADARLIARQYLRTAGEPVTAVKTGLARLLPPDLAGEAEVCGVGVTGSGRQLAAVVLGADVVKNEITAHGAAAVFACPGTRTVIEIGGQDSKIILLRDGLVRDFAMNTVCAAGTGSFIDQQAARLGLPVEELGRRAAASDHSIRLAGRCGVFAESDMIHKQQMGYPLDAILMGLCESLARNYLNNVARGKKIEGPIVFQGGVAANAGIKKAFAGLLQQELTVPEHYDVMGALGTALLSREEYARDPQPSRFKGMDYVQQGNFVNRSFVCSGCPNQCEVAAMQREGQTLACWGDRCRRWESLGACAPKESHSIKPFAQGRETGKEKTE
ncbi:MAG: acyl-CoA dehydratase activase [Syntrophomonadaceae bacterium]|nr:acyl-CoA dehydratase activase [Syntrophomonadaceae bacterium]